MLAFGGDYATVPDDVITHIKQRLDQLRQKNGAPFQSGQRVRIATDHPLARLDAVFEKSLSGGARARILIEIVGRLTRCDVAMGSLKADD